MQVGNLTVPPNNVVCCLFLFRLDLLKKDTCQLNSSNGQFDTPPLNNY
ncbi:hypothetical protein SAMN05660226_03768 [Parapedobacter luteus]|uniref:Uncharacterized protein n=1 Tax=Parapedobacter luteus TaxID=623280 RepID=A0A1T5F4B3_9SPHI|nr:hypothetical protein SAMN05660226_03768 [Parapedobacter luteus]